MAKKMGIYKCEICGNIVEVLHAGDGELVCCGKPMKEMLENTVDASKEKHVPVIEKTENGVLVKIGSIPHPMEEKHYIEWIQVLANGQAYRKFLKPLDKPEAFFEIKSNEFIAREYCNIHGLWSAKG